MSNSLSNYTSLVKSIQSSPLKVGDKAKKIFTDLENYRVDVYAEAKIKYNNLFRKAADDLQNKKINYTTCHKEYNKIKNQQKEHIDYRMRNYDGGCVDKFQDIYDALSRGRFSKEGMVNFGHGTTYFKSGEKVTAEIIADYISIKIFRPDLVNILK